MAVTNAEIMDKIDRKIIPLIEENKANVSAAIQRVDKIEPLVHNHQLILFGDPNNRKDEGMIGVLNNIDELVRNIKSFVKPVALTVLTAFVMWAIKTGVDIYLLLQLN